ncbi:serine hydrolase domain-containing protein [Actinoplanes subglobosus]|uniref:Serine hydrolase domain-containing protein n=1 Tax=Actinoplanes subglobosus TaxID=1547892 RepID=A0ABV8J4D1_9ACTN
MATTELQNRIQRHLDTLVDSGAESAVQAAAYRDGELIVDAAAGPVTARTPIFSFSTGKNVTAVLAHELVARGFTGFDDPVADLWPEFGAGGKTAVTLRHVLTHTAGLPAMPQGIGPAELPDWATVCDALAAAGPRWPAGEAMGYHPYTFGYLVGEIARRATGHPVRELLREWITEPLGLDGQLFYGVPEESLPGLPPLDEEERDGIPGPWESAPSAGFGNSAEILRADIPSVATGTAYALATVFDRALADPVRFAGMSAVAYEGDDVIFGTPVRMALGFPIGRIGAAAEERSAAIGWPGGGGSYAYADPVRGIAFALTKTRLTPHFDTALSTIAIVEENTPATG